MKQQFFNALLSFGLIVLVTGCLKDKHDGQGTFSAKINGRELLPCVRILTMGGPIRTTSDFFLSAPAGYLSISSTNRCDPAYTYGRNIHVSFDSVILAANTLYKFGNGFSAVRGQVTCTYMEDLTQYVSDSTLPGSITILAFDTASRRISASFDATLREINSGQLKTLTQGKFNLTY